MKMSREEKLDKEHEARIQQLSSQLKKNGRIAASDIFLSKAVARSIETEKVFIGSYSPREILTNYPFASEVYVLICPHCKCVSGKSELRALLEHGAITPVLLGSYAKYPKKFVDEILPFPHLSRHEYHFYRYVRLVSDAELVLCNHCAHEKHMQLKPLLVSKFWQHEAEIIGGEFFSNLYPFVDTDFELIEEFEAVVKKGDLAGVEQIVDLSKSIQEARTIQAMRARSAIPRDVLPKALKETKGFENLGTLDFDAALKEVNEALERDLELKIPEGVTVDKYLEIVDPYRKELGGIVESILSSSVVEGRTSVASLSARLADLNDELLALPKKTRFLFYRGTMAFLRANKALLASGMVAGVMGLGGHMLGCGATLAGGLGIQIAKRKVNVKLPREAQRVGEQVSHRVRPVVNRVLSKCLRLDIRAVQLWEIKEKLRSASGKTSKR